MGAIVLPTQKSKPNLDFINQKFLTIGASGIGKSNFWAQEDKALFIETEAGLNFESVMKLPARSWNDIRDIYASLRQAEKDNKFPYSMIVIDTGDRLLDLAEEEIVNRAREFYKSIADQINTIGDIPNGGGWSKTRELMMNFINKMEQLPCALSIISHLSTKRVEEGVRKYDKHTISLWAGMGNDMLAWADHILHVESQIVGDKMQRTVYTIPTQTREAKSRGGVIPNQWKWEADAKVNYAMLRKMFT